MTDYNFVFNKHQAKKTAYILFAVLVLILSVFAMLFINHMIKVEEEASALFLEQSVLQTASNIKNRVRNDINDLKVLSKTLPLYSPNLSNKEILDFLTNNVKDPKYHRLGFAYSDGRAVRYEEKAGKLPYIDWNDEACFQVALNGYSCFAEALESPSAASGFVNRYFVPVYNSANQIIGVLGSLNDSDIFKKILNLNTYNGQGFSRVIDSDGNLIIKSPQEKNIDKNFFELKFKLLNISKDQLKKDLKTKKSGTFSFDFNGVTYLAAYATIENNECFVLTDVPKDILMHRMTFLLGVISFIIILFSALILALLLYTNFIDFENEKKIYKFAFVDDVTDSTNKNKFLLDAKNSILAKKRDNFAILSIDISKFKVINELYGYKRANKIIKDIFCLLKNILPNNSLICREHAATYLVFMNYKDKNEILNYINKVTEKIKKYNLYVIQKLTSNTESRLVSQLTLLFGIYLIDDTNIPVSQMCDRAAIAKNIIKDAVGVCYKFYDDGLRAEILKDKAIEDEMIFALKDNQFKLYLQPKFSLETQQLCGAESLVRWVHPVRGVVPPSSFVPLFERNGFIIDLDKCIWKQTCEFLSNRKQQGQPLFPISVNVSRLHLLNDVFIDNLATLVKKYDIDPKYLELELTESACLNNEERFVDIINRLKALGFSIAMDDFGTGYSSLNMLRLLNVDILKLDRGFVNDTIMSEKGKAVIECVISMADRLNMKTVAEGVETQEQAAFLKSVGCKIVQGFLYGRPMDVDKFTKTFLDDPDAICQDFEEQLEI